MASGKVSAQFNQAFAKASGIDEAKKAEVQMMNSIPVPVGWAGQCKVLDMIADVSKKGNMYVNMDLTPTEGEYAGKKITKNWTFSQTEKMSPADQMERFLNDLEIAGMPRELRVSFEGIEELINWWLDPDYVREISCEHVESGGRKYFNFKRPNTPVDTSNSIAPSAGLPPKNTEGGDYSEGKVVYWNEAQYTIVKDNGETLDVTSKLTGKPKTLPKSECSFTA